MENHQPENKKKDLSISLSAANLYAIPLIIIPFILFALPYYLLWGKDNLVKGFNDFTNITVFIVVFIIGIILHEFIHGLCWVIFGRQNWDKIKFGFNAKTITPYAHCKVPVEARAYKIGTSAPGILMGIFPAVLALFTGSSWLLWFGIIFTIAAGGDILILWIIRKVNASQLVEDHPSRAGCFVYED